MGRSDETLLRELVERHLRYTGSTLALAILDDWDTARRKFVKVFPVEYKRALTELYGKRTAPKPAPVVRTRAAA
jgi:glutamate synthase (NADPH) large chain